MASECSACETKKEERTHLSHVLKQQDLKWFVCPWCNKRYCSNCASFDKDCPTPGCHGILAKDDNSMMWNFGARGRRKYYDNPPS
jgi:uncharacterized protein YlaI